jgi:hypothetical protein
MTGQNRNRTGPEPVKTGLPVLVLVFFFTKPVPVFSYLNFFKTDPKPVMTSQDRSSS